MLITFSGPQCSGKSTLLSKMEEVYGNRFVYVKEAVRKIVREKGLKVNQDGDDLVQLLITSAHLESALLPNAVLDRCILDSSVYAHYLYRRGKISKWVYHYSIDMMNFLSPKYDIMFYTSPNIPLVEDGFRSVDKEFRDEISRFFVEFINTSFKDKIVVLKGTVEERMEIVKATLGSHNPFDN